MSYECTDDARHDSKTLFKGMALGAPALFLPWNGAGIPVVRDHGDAEEDGLEQYHGHRFYGMTGVAVGAASFAAPCDMLWWFQMVVDQIEGSGPEFWDEIGWNGWKRLLYGNYFYMKYLSGIKRKMRHFISLF